jgi:hypothetical protein
VFPASDQATASGVAAALGVSPATAAAVLAYEPRLRGQYPLVLARNFSALRALLRLPQVRVLCSWLQSKQVRNVTVLTSAVAGGQGLAARADVCHTVLCTSQRV